MLPSLFDQPRMPMEWPKEEPEPEQPEPNPKKPPTGNKSFLALGFQGPILNHIH
jgi:hypothetical protein